MTTQTDPDDGYSAANMAYRAGQLAQQNIDLAARLHPPLRRRAGLLIVNIVLFGIAVYCFYLLGRFDRAPLVGSQDLSLPTAVIDRRPAPTSDYGVADYNRRQEAARTAQEQPQASPLPTAAPVSQEAAGDVYIIVTPTAEALPEPNDPAFAESFQEPMCSAMITYLKGNPCYGRVNQAPQAQPGSDGFRESFK